MTVILPVPAAISSHMAASLPLNVHPSLFNGVSSSDTKRSALTSAAWLPIIAWTLFSPLQNEKQNGMNCQTELNIIAMNHYQDETSLG